MTEEEAAEFQRLREVLSRRQSIDVPRVPLPPQASPDLKSESEARGFAGDDLDTVAKQNEHNRTETFRNSVAWGVLVLFWAVVIGAILMGAFWLWHIVTPDCLHFLSPAAVDKIQTLLIGGTSSGFMSGYAKKKLGP